MRGPQIKREKGISGVPRGLKASSLNPHNIPKPSADPGSEFKVIVPRKWIEYAVYGDLIIRYPKPYSIYLMRTI